MKILIFSAFYGMPGSGEEATRYSALAGQFLMNGHEVVYITSSFSHIHKNKRKKPDDLNDKLQIVLLPVRPYYKNVGLNRILNHYDLSISLSQWLENVSVSNPFDLVIGVSPPVFANYVLAKYCKKSRIPFIYDMQDLWPEEFIKLVAFKGFLRFLLRPYFSAAEKIVEIASGVTAVSSEYLDYYQRNIWDKPAKVFNLGVDTKGFIGVPKDDDKGNGIKRIIMLGNAQFAPHVLMAAKAVQNIPDAELIVCGLKEQTPTFKKIIEKHKLERVVFIEWLAKKEIEETLPGYDAGLVWINPGSKIAFPHRVFTYFAAGLPVINNIRGGDLDNYIKQNNLGTTTCTDSEKALEEGIKYCLENFGTEDHKRIQQFARAHFDKAGIYEQYYNWAKSITNYK